MAKRMDFVDILIQQGIISVDQADEARESGEEIDTFLYDNEYAEEDEIAKAKAEIFKVQYIDLDGTEIPEEVIALIPESTARNHSVIPISDDGKTLLVTMLDPMNMDLIDDLRFVTTRRIDTAISGPLEMQDALKKYYNAEEDLDAVGRTIEGIVKDDTTQYRSIDDVIGDEEEIDENSAPIVRLTQLIISEAIKARASDIHIEPFEEKIRIRYRIDGRLVERDSAPIRLNQALLSRVKILAKMDIAEKRRPQDGRITLMVGEKKLDLRVSVLPTNHGQSVVMRILDSDSIQVGLQDLGFADADYKIFRELIVRPNGIILVTGPTGSGKTTSLYAALNDLNGPGHKIITAEDPVEYYLAGVNQVQVRHEIGLDFARIIRAMLRQAPNVILVGEIRDQETANMAIQASLTGHLVFSTLHTNDAPSSVTRMTDLGVPSYLVASSVIAVMAQRLLRTNCKECVEDFEPSESVLREARIPPKVAAKAIFQRGYGCNRCGKSGYKGRMAIFELMQMTSKIREYTFKGAQSADIRKAAIEQGMRTLYKDGLIKALKGFTTLEEVFRVARLTEQD